MQTTITHNDGELVGYVGLGGRQALLLYPFWLFRKYGAVGSKAFDLYQFDRGYAVHLGLVGFQWLTKRKKTPHARAVEKEQVLPFPKHKAA